MLAAPMAMAAAVATAWHQAPCAPGTVCCAVRVARAGGQQRVGAPLEQCARGAGRSFTESFHVGCAKLERRAARVHYCLQNGSWLSCVQAQLDLQLCSGRWVLFPLRWCVSCSRATGATWQRSSPLTHTRSTASHSTLYCARRGCGLLSISQRQGTRQARRNLQTAASLAPLAPSPGGSCAVAAAAAAAATLQPWCERPSRPKH